MKPKIYENMIARRSRMDYIPGMQFQTSLVNTEEAKEITMRNQLEKKQKNGIGVAPSSTYEFLPRISL